MNTFRTVLALAIVALGLAVAVAPRRPADTCTCGPACDCVECGCGPAACPPARP
jgi:hypothetical protein